MSGAESSGTQAEIFSMRRSSVRVLTLWVHKEVTRVRLSA